MAPTPSIDEKDKTRGAVASPLGERMIDKETTGSAETFYLFHGPAYFGRTLAGLTEMLATESGVEGWKRFTPHLPMSLLPLLFLPLPPSFHLFFLPNLLERLLHARNACNGYKHASCPPGAPMFTHNGLIFIPI